MTDFTTALPVIRVLRTCPGDQRAKGVNFLSTCNPSREGQKSQVWLCFLVLSLLSTSTCAASLPDTGDLQICLEMLKPTIEKSDAMLYAPSIQHANCRTMSLRCYMLELIMVINEEEIMDSTANCIFDFNDKLPPEANSVGCPPCEAYSLQNITIFLDSLESLLKQIKMNKDS